ncbi:hypothetical protein DBB29_02825 [Pandoraea cepalis]|uniref:Uncharacterized protein n=1 Tax=Pandoraea cepalis TaxID=2508294 RepID=A0AAW7MIQ3_9BURK|nr:hypothetical protein [Pandoraea cepalis]MDN4577054.1 hypothetical protein [Pandoraea cepalis]
MGKGWRAFLARKIEGEPGANTIWESLQRVIISAETLRALRGEATRTEMCIAGWPQAAIMFTLNLNT